MKPELEALVVNNMGLVYDVVNKYKTRICSVFEYEDAIQTGVIGLIQAANTYDDTKNIAFSTYAFVCIKNYILTQVRITLNKRNNMIEVSMDAPVNDDEDFSLAFTLADDFNLAEASVKNSQIDLLYEYIAELPDTLQKIMLLRCRNITFKQIAEILNLSELYTQQQYQKGLNILRYKFKVGKDNYDK